MNRCKLALALLISFLMVSLLPYDITVKAQQSAYGGEWVADNTRQNIHHPTAIYIPQVDTTFFVYMTNVSNTYKFYAKQFNHTTENMSDEVYIDDSVSTDRHHAPSIGYLPNGSLIIFYDTHSYTPGYISYRVSQNAWDITTWNSEQHEIGDFTYPQLVSFDDKLVLFVRESQADMVSCIWYRYDFNNTHFWQNKTQISYWSGSGVAESFYVMTNRVGDNIYLSMTFYNETASPSVHINLYFGYSEDKGVSWKKADGTSLSLPLGENAKILDLPHKTYSSFPFTNYEGNPLITFTKGVGVYGGEWQQLILARWDGSSWAANNITNQHSQILNFSLVFPEDQSEWRGLTTYPILDQVFHRPAFWAPSVGDEKLSRYIQSEGDPFTFIQILETEIDCQGGYILCVQNHKPPYEAFADIWGSSGIATGYFLYNKASYLYTFQGVYDEDTGSLYDPSERAVNVTAYFTNQEPESFELNGTYWYGAAYQPLYFSMNTSTLRQYWLSEDETEATIKIYDTSLTTYAINFLDLGGVLEDYQIITASRYIAGSLTVVEKRKVDVENKIVMALKNGEKYIIVIEDGSTYTFGDLLFTDSPSITLTLRGIAFPKEVLLTHKYVRIYALRVFAEPNGTITITYQDTLNLTGSVEIYIKYRNGTTAYHPSAETSSSFSHQWTSALNNTDYQVECIIDHGRYGISTWRQYMPRTYTTNPWDSLAFLGALPFNINLLVGSLLILFVGGGFSQVNPEVGALLATFTAAGLTYIGWISIAPGLLITALTFSILLGIVVKKRGLR